MSDISEGNKRAAYKKMVNDLKPVFINALTKDDRYDKRGLEKFFNSEIGEGVMCSILGVSFKTTKIKGFEDIQDSVSKEMKTIAYDKVGGLVAELATGPISAAIFSLVNQSSTLISTTSGTKK
jgi:hypothetical protein